jgi:signal peptidase I
MPSVDEVAKEPGKEPRATPSARRGEGSGGATARRLLKQLAELPILVVLAFGIAVLIKTFLIQAFYIPSGSMQRTLDVGDRVLVEKLSYRIGDPVRGQVIVFAKSVLPGRQPDLPWQEDFRNLIREVLGLPTGREEDYIKRIVALGGDKILYSGKPRHLVVNGERVPEPYVKSKDRFSTAITPGNCRGMGLMSAGDEGCRVPAGRVFVMGDNRPDSQDSRLIGPIKEQKVVGRAFVIIWPLDHFAGL